MDDDDADGYADGYDDRGDGDRLLDNSDHNVRLHMKSWKVGPSDWAGCYYLDQPEMLQPTGRRSTPNV